MVYREHFGNPFECEFGCRQMAKSQLNLIFFSGDDESISIDLRIWSLNGFRSIYIHVKKNFRGICLLDMFLGVEGRGKGVSWEDFGRI